MNKRIMIGVPINRWLSPKTSIALSKALFYFLDRKYTVDINYDNGSVIAQQRNKIFRAAHKEKMDLLFIDSDMVFELENRVR